MLVPQQTASTATTREVQLNPSSLKTPLNGDLLIIAATSPHKSLQIRIRIPAIDFFGKRTAENIDFKTKLFYEATRSLCISYCCVLVAARLI